MEQPYQSLTSISKKYLSEKFLLSKLVQQYKIKFRTWRIMANEHQIGMVTSASRPIIRNGKIETILVHFSFLSPIDNDKVSKFEGHRNACIKLLTQKSYKITPDPEKPGLVKDVIKLHLLNEIFKRKSFWLREVWDNFTGAKIDIV